MTLVRLPAVADRVARTRARWQPFVLVLAMIAITAGVELRMGRTPFGPDGRFGWWEADVWSSENSQRVADAYSFSHFVHGMIFFGLLWLLARRLPIGHRLLFALLIEVGWEILENSPLIIDRYRAVTIAIGYVGDSVLNSCCDVVAMSLGFLFASRVPVRLSVATGLAMELFCLAWVRDNLLLNVLMLIHPVEAIKLWQSAGHPLP
jgi:uncharacterized protein DUF2585